MTAYIYKDLCKLDNLKTKCIEVIDAYKYLNKTLNGRFEKSNDSSLLNTIDRNNTIIAIYLEILEIINDDEKQDMTESKSKKPCQKHVILFDYHKPEFEEDSIRFYGKCTECLREFCETYRDPKYSVMEKDEWENYEMLGTERLE